MAVNDDRLHMACRDNDVDLVDRLLSWRANVNHTDEHLQTPLMLACHEGHDGVVESLLKENDELRQSVSDTEGQLDSVQTEKNEVAARLAEMSEELGERNNELQERQTELEELEKKNSNLVEQVNDAERNYQKLLEEKEKMRMLMEEDNQEEEVNDDNTEADTNEDEGAAAETEAEDDAVCQGPRRAEPRGHDDQALVQDICKQAL